MPGGRYVDCKVACEAVTLKLSFQPKHLEKPFVEALLKPFLKAFNKKRADKPVITVDDIASIVVTDEAGTREVRGRR